ncbi:MAG: AEC family transporter [Butyricicoccaceae bacterium]
MDIKILLSQIVIMFLLMAIGAAAYRFKIISDRGSKEFSGLLVKLVAPCVIIHAFLREYDSTMFRWLLQSLLLSLLLFALSAVVAALIFSRKQTDWADKQMCTLFMNNGFMALPLLQALFGDDGVFIGSICIVAMNFVLWTYGVTILSAATKTAQKIDLKKILLNPGTVGFCIGVVLFLFSPPLPSVLTETIGFMSDLNTPLAMLVLGVYLAQSDLITTLKDRATYTVCAARLILIPILCLAILLILPLDPLVERVIMVSFATPCAVASSMFAQMYGTNYLYSSRIIAFSTLLSAVTMPLVLSLYSLLA